MYNKREIYRHIPAVQTDCYDTLLIIYADELRKSVRTCDKSLTTPLSVIGYQNLRQFRFSTNESKKNYNQSCLARMRFPALGAGCMSICFEFWTELCKARLSSSWDNVNFDFSLITDQI